VFPLLAVKNREIVKSVLGFVKLTIHSLSPAIIQPQLPSLVPALIICLSTHRHHFKVKIRHIFERLLRKFGAADIEQFALESGADHEGAVKMILNIKKRKERAARKKTQVAERDDDDSDDVSLFLLSPSLAPLVNELMQCLGACAKDGYWGCIRGCAVWQ
jgi:ribosomal RNA-processing protein 12